MDRDDKDNLPPHIFSAIEAELNKIDKAMPAIMAHFDNLPEEDKEKIRDEMEAAVKDFVDYVHFKRFMEQVLPQYY